MKNFLKLAASLVLMGGFLWAAFRNVEGTRLEEALQTANPLWLLLSAIIIIASGLPRAWRWRILLLPVAPNISIRSAFWAVMVAYAGNVVFPRAGEVARALALERDHPTGISAILATVIVERLLDILTLLIIFGIVLFFAREQIGAAFPGLEQVALLAVPIILFAFVFLGVLSARGERGLSIFPPPAGTPLSQAGRWCNPYFAFFFAGHESYSHCGRLRGNIGIHPDSQQPLFVRHVLALLQL